MRERVEFNGGDGLSMDPCFNECKECICERERERNTKEVIDILLGPCSSECKERVI